MSFFETANALLKNNEHLSGWAQFLGAMIALGVTYVTANLPAWTQERREKERLRKLHSTAPVLIETGYKLVKDLFELPPGYTQRDSYGLRRSAYRISGVLAAFDRFPVHELEDQGVEGGLPERVATMAAVLRHLSDGVLEWAKRLDGPSQMANAVEGAKISALYTDAIEHARLARDGIAISAEQAKQRR